MILAINALDGAGFHDISVAINEDGEIPATAVTTARKMQALVKSTEWPDELGDGADALEQALSEMASAIGAANASPESAGEIAERVHDVEHDFSGEVWAYIYGETDIESGAGGHD